MKMPKTTGIPLTIDVEGKLNFFGKIGLFFIKIGGWIIRKNCINLKIKS